MKRCASVTILGLAVAKLAMGAEVLRANFDAVPVGDYSFAACQAAFPGVTWNNGLSPDSRVRVVEGGDTAWSGRALRVFYPATCLGPSGTGGALACGAQWRSNIGGTRDTLMLRYRVFFPKGFEWVKGGKLPGLCGSQCNTGGNIPTGTDGWSTRIMWRSNAQLTLYLYYPGQSGTYGTDLVFKDSTGKTLGVPTGVWHELVTKVSLNTPATAGAGKSDGRVQAWFNGKLAVDSGGFRFRDRDTMHVNQFYFSTFYGGNTNDFSPPSDNQIFFDDFQIADTLVPGRTTSIRRLEKTSSSSGLRIQGRTLHWDGRESAKVTMLRPDGSIELVRDLQARPEAVDLQGSGVVVWNLEGPSVRSGGLAYLP
jgi:hypothetical protein